MNSSRDALSIGSGTVVALGLLGIAIILVSSCDAVGWDPTWRAFGVTPLHPPFFDMHVVNDYAACAWKGVDPYAMGACSVVNFNIPPIWLWLGHLGVNGADSPWLAATIIATAAIVMVFLLKGRSWPQGVVALAAVISPSVMMGVERANLDLLILALVGVAALIYCERGIGRASVAMAFLFCGVVLKLFPMFCISVAARFSKRALLFACVTAAVSLTYLGLILNYVFLIRRNVPTTFVLSYGYKTIFLGLDHIRSEAGLTPLGLADTWLPACTAAAVLICAAIFAVVKVVDSCKRCEIQPSTAGTAFLFGAGIYCGTYLLGTNYIYRLMFLLLCVPQLLDWQVQDRESTSGLAEQGLFGTILGVLWLNGNSNGHFIFLLFPQLLNWFLFFCMTAVLILNFLRTAAAWAFTAEALHQASSSDRALQGGGGAEQ